MNQNQYFTYISFEIIQVVIIIQYKVLISWRSRFFFFVYEIKRSYFAEITDQKRKISLQKAENKSRALATLLRITVTKKEKKKKNEILKVVGVNCKTL